MPRTVTPFPRTTVARKRVIDDHLLRLDESLHGDALLMEAAELIMEAAQLIASMDGDSEFFERVYNAVYPDARGL